jgi:preprotein translocase subunit SecF
MDFPNIFKGDYRLLCIPPLLLILISFYFIPHIQMGVDFQGGTLVTLTLKGAVDAPQLKSELASEGLQADVDVVQTTSGYQAEIEVPQSPKLVEADQLKSDFNALVPDVSFLEVESLQNSSNTTQYLAEDAKLQNISDQMFAIAGMSRSDFNITGTIDEQKAFTTAYNKVYSDYATSVSGPIDKYVQYSSMSIQTVSPTLSTEFIGQAISVVIASALLSIVFVFVFFRDPFPAAAVLCGAFSDVTIAMGAMGLFGIQFTLPSFAALLMLIGFSLDTDVLLTMRILKRKGDPREKAYGAMKTGLTMSLTAIVAFITLFVLAILTNIPTYYEISAVALAGLVGDMFATWGIDAVLLLWHVEKLNAAEKEVV